MTSLTCFDKKDHSGSIEFLVWLDSIFCVEYIHTMVKVSRENVDHGPSYGNFYDIVLGSSDSIKD